MRKLSISRLLALSPCAFAAACGGGGDASDAPEAAAATVTFVQPADGATVTGPDVSVVLAVTGVEIVPVTDTRPGTGHHHVYIDEDVDVTGSIPMDQPNIRHFGTGVQEFVLTGLEPGQRRLIAVVADARHVPLSPLVADTITINVTSP